MIVIYEQIIKALAKDKSLKLIDIDDGEKPKLHPAAQINIKPIKWDDMGDYKSATISFDTKITYRSFQSSESKSPAFAQLKDNLSLTDDIKTALELMFHENIIQNVRITGEGLTKKGDNYICLLTCQALAFSQI